MDTIYGLYRGYVIDVNDPEKLGRLILQCPQVWGEGVTHDYWAYPFGVYAANGAGFALQMVKGDMVWVAFEGGDPAYPVWCYGHWNDLNAAPNGLFTKGINKLRFKGGGAIEIDDKGRKINIIAKDGGAIQPAVMGDENAAALRDIKTMLGDLKGELSKLNTAIKTYTAAAGAALPPLAAAAGVFAPVSAAIGLKLGVIETDLQKFERVTIPKTKSKNIKHD